METATTEEKKLTAKEISAGLRQFSGTEHWYAHWTGGSSFTDGIKFLCDHGECYWMVDLISFFQHDKRVTRDRMLKGCQFWKLKLDPIDPERGGGGKWRSATLFLYRDSDDLVLSHRIDTTDFPLEEVDIWLEAGGPDGKMVLLLPGEH